jgi:hypothetical protein
LRATTAPKAAHSAALSKASGHASEAVSQSALTELAVGLPAGPVSHALALVTAVPGIRIPWDQKNIRLRLNLSSGGFRMSI